jgi:glycyl-tRNA synthetase beta chain
MPQLLLELFCEEIPARMQAQAGRDLERMARERLAEAGFLPEAVKSFAGPRRLTLVIEGLLAAQPDRTEERKGPKVGAPQAALDGFLRSTGLTQDQLTERDGVYIALTAKPGRPTPEVIAEMVPAIIRAFPWPKSMKWGTGSLRWVRPLQRILCVFDGEIVPFEIEGIESGDMTEGHRFMGSRAPFRARHFEAYAAGLEANFVVLDPEERKARILEGARTLCFARSVELVDDQGLLDEVAGLAEWPTPILGDMDPAFLDLPPEVIRTSMRTHQKYFAVRDPKTGGLAPNFLVVSNIEARDGGHLVSIGNARVLSARLNDARFFWDEDRKTPLETRLEKLKAVTFHAKLGTLYQRAMRISALAGQIAELIGADRADAERAGLLAKADLTCGMVGEFPELQGLMGGYYARQQGEPDAVADAIRDHYKPQGPADSVPTALVSVAVALAEKLDTLVGFFAIDEKPTGSKDPYALRRAALGVIRLILDNNVTLPLTGIIRNHVDLVVEHARPYLNAGQIINSDSVSVQQALLSFFADRLKVVLRDQAQRIDVVDSIFASNDDDLLRVSTHVKDLSDFLATNTGENLLSGFNRAASIIDAENKKSSVAIAGEPILIVGAPVEETNLYEAIQILRYEVAHSLSIGNFKGAILTLSALRGPVDDFFDKVFVNDPDPALRDNRLRLLMAVRDTMQRVADFSLING